MLRKSHLTRRMLTPFAGRGSKPGPLTGAYVRQRTEQRRARDYFTGMPNVR